jgi:ElaB/YqjD/DUF883 family membrane-anchored ribosome-binding protein
MANLDFDKIIKMANDVADKSVSFAKKAADKAVQTAKIAKLNAEIVSEKDKVKKAYQEIGKIYYHLHKDDPEADFTGAFEALEAAIGNIKQKNADIKALKSDGLEDIVCPDAEDADIDELIDEVDEEAEEVATEAEEAVEEAAEAVEEAAEEVAEEVKEAAEEITEE